MLIAHGVQAGDRVCIYLPMIPELAVHDARLRPHRRRALGGLRRLLRRVACATASSTPAAKLVVTANEGLRGGKRIPLKATVDDAIEGLDSSRRCWSRAAPTPTCRCARAATSGCDEEMSKQRSTCPVEWMDAESPLFILYTSGSTGKPKGVLHTTGGYLVYAALTHGWSSTCTPDDIYFCAADIGWVTGHSYIVYGPLANGATTVMFESIPLYPDAGRYWRMVDDLGVTIFYTAPTALRAIAREGDEWVKKLLAQVAAHPRHGRRADQPRGLEVVPRRGRRGALRGGRHLVADRDRRHPDHAAARRDARPSRARRRCRSSASSRCWSTTRARCSKATASPATSACARSWPGQARTIYGDHARFRETYFSRFPGLYFTGDGCRRDEDGYYWITGRVDDVLNVSGHRLGTAEVESALVGHEAVAEAAVVGFPHDIKGDGHLRLRASSSRSTRARDPEELVGALKQQVRQRDRRRSPRPTASRSSPGLPKTRSGKIMRRILRKIAAGEYERAGRHHDARRPGGGREAGRSGESLTAALGSTHFFHSNPTVKGAR